MKMSAAGTAGITLHDARTIVEGALAHARGSDFPPMTAVGLRGDTGTADPT
jgi:hypothetical protein